jgi:phospholipase C
MWDRLERRGIERRRLRAGPASRPRAEQPAGTDLLPQLKHIVVLMLENHSYDNYLGTLAGRGDGSPTDASGAPSAVNTLPNGQRVRAHHLPSTSQVAGNPTQTWRASHISYGDGNCDGFGASVWETVPGGDPAIPMGYWTAAELPFYHGLARVFPVADRWFCSCLGPTFPNRRFLISGTAHGLIDDLPWDRVDYPEAGTIFDALTRHDISWVNYHNVHPIFGVLKRLLGAPGLVFLRRLASVGRWIPGVTNAVRGNMSYTADLYPLGLAGAVRHLRTTRQFFADAATGALPAVSIVDPDFGRYSEENPQDIALGEEFSAAVVNAVMRGPAWESTLLLWIYDEHGGYYDHVPPPEAAVPDDAPAQKKLCARLDNVDGGPASYDRYGFRVPAVVVSPYARPDFVLHDTLDHTSVLKLIEEKWNLPPLTRRDAAAVSPLAALDFTRPPAFLTPPELPAAKTGTFGPMQRMGTATKPRR